MKLSISVLSIFFSVLVHLPASAHTKQPWRLQEVRFKGAKIRTGILKTAHPKRGTVLYLQGLGDSMMNHEALFSAVSNAGFDVIAFDYMGQGGSGGSMNRTTIANINTLADQVWRQYVKDETQKKILIGWSTGGLAAYRYAYKYPQKVEKMFLIAPGIVPKWLVGERMMITVPSLTSVPHNELELNDPHVDPVRPRSPLFVPAFSLNLQAIAAKARRWEISPEVSGHVFLSSEEDTYVNSAKTIEVLERNAAHLDYTYYAGTGALHELDNEIEPVAKDLRETIVAELLRP